MSESSSEATVPRPNANPATRPSTHASTRPSANPSGRLRGYSTQTLGDEERHFRRGSETSSLGVPGVLEYAGVEAEEGEGGEEDNMLRNDSSSVIEFYPRWCHCVSFLRRTNPYAPGLSWRQSFRQAFLCPPQGPCARILTFVIIFIMGWGLTWLLLLNVDPEHHNHSPAAIKSPIFALAILELTGLFAGIFMKACGLPSLLGPLLLGIVLRNVGPLNIFKYFVGWGYRNCANGDHHCEAEALKSGGNWIKPIRQLALTLILTRAGVELSPKQLKKLKGVVPLLAFVPCLVEACTCALVTYLLFNVAGDGNNAKIGIYMCFVSGFALAAVSPAVVVPGMLSLKKRNYGVGQGIPTLLIAASSIDDVLAISLYTIFLGFALAADGWQQYAAGPIGIAVGILHGFIVGIFLHFIPARGSKSKAENRLVLLLLFNFLAMFGYEEFDLLSGAGSLAVLMTAFIASFGWRSYPHWKHSMKKVERKLSILWTLMVPVLFGTIGREIDFNGVGFTGQRVAKILGIIVICLFIRCLTAFCICYAVKGITWRERLFAAMSWIPKATVQAALAPLVVSKIQAKGESAEDLAPHGQIVVTTAVLGIIITAPLGSVLIAIFGTRLLRLATEPERRTLDEEFPNGEGIDPEEESDAIVVVNAPPNGKRRTLGSSSSLENQSQAKPPATPRRSASAEGTVASGSTVTATPTPTTTSLAVPEETVPEKKENKAPASSFFGWNKK